MTGIYTPARWGTFGRATSSTRGKDTSRNYRSRDGIQVPSEEAVGWYVNAAWRPAWRGTLLPSTLTTPDRDAAFSRDGETLRHVDYFIPSLISADRRGWFVLLCRHLRVRARFVLLV